MEVKNFNTYKDILVQCYKHQEALEEVIGQKSTLSFATLRQAQELHRKNEELIENIYSTIRGKEKGTKPTTDGTSRKSAQIFSLFE